MHHFICPAQYSWDQLTVRDTRVVHQTTRVLRMHPWSSCIIQDPIDGIRRTVELIQLSKDQISGRIISEQSRPDQELIHTILCIAYPNQVSKLELIIQKTTEIWIDEICRFDADRSQVHSLSSSKHARWELIALEAAEQSHRWSVPTIRYDCRFDKLITKYANNAIVFEQSDSKHILHTETSTTLAGFVWPEGWRSDRELAIFQTNRIPTIWLWDTVLRMESAAIIWWWKMIQRS